MISFPTTWQHVSRKLGRLWFVIIFNSLLFPCLYYFPLIPSNIVNNNNKILSFLVKFKAVAPRRCEISRIYFLLGNQFYLNCHFYFPFFSSFFLHKIRNYLTLDKRARSTNKRKYLQSQKLIKQKTEWGFRVHIYIFYIDRLYVIIINLFII